MTSTNEIGGIPNECCLIKPRYYSGEFDRIQGTSSHRNESAKFASILSTGAMQKGRNPARKVSDSGSDCEGDWPWWVRQIQSSERVNYIGHALLLPRGRVWCPRINHDLRADCPHSGRAGALYTGNGLVLDLASDRPRPRFRRSLSQSAPAANSLAHPCPRPVNVQRRGMSPHSPHPGTLRGQSAHIPRAFPVRELTSAAECPCPHRGIVISVSGLRSRHPVHQTESSYVLI